jgi:hypothetical protein
VIAGEAEEGRAKGPVAGLSVAPKFVDVVLPAGAVFREDIEPGHTAFAYLDRGEVTFGEGDEAKQVQGPALVVFGRTGAVHASGGRRGGRFFLAAAQPLNEPIARYGPFVMNTREEIEQTLDELRSGRFIREEATDA